MSKKAYTIVKLRQPLEAYLVLPSSVMVAVFESLLVLHITVPELSTHP